MLLFLLFLLLETCEMTNSNAAVASAVPRVVVTPAELMARVSEIKASTIVGVTLNTEVQLLKRHRDTKEPCVYGPITKRTVMSCAFGTDYERGVNRRLDKEGSDPSFEAAPHQWADRVEDKPAICTNKAGDTFYANLRVLGVQSVEYLQDGKPIDAAELADYLPKKSTSSRQGTEDQIIWRTVKFTSFESVRANGVELVVSQA
jgi:hypothetical protein